MMNGIIPAHAGLTDMGEFENVEKGDHPRACGAHFWRVRFFRLFRGSSPRMRGSQFHLEFREFDGGIIPAHAGLTNTSRTAYCQPWDHPRACGAHAASL